MTATAKRDQGNREKLLQAAVECLREKGYARTTARDLVAASGTNLASIGYHFGSKEALLNEAVALGFRAWTEEIERATFGEESASSIERLERSLAAMIDRFDEIEPFILSFVEAYAQAVRSPELRERMAASYEEARAAGADMIMRSVQADGIEMDERHAQTLSALFTAVCDGLMLQYLLDPDRVPSSREVLESVAGGVAAFVAAGA